MPSENPLPPAFSDADSKKNSGKFKKEPMSPPPPLRGSEEHFHKKGKYYVCGLAASILIVLSAGLTYKWVNYSSIDDPKKKAGSHFHDFIDCDEAGISTIRRSEDLMWYVQELVWFPIRDRLEARNKRIGEVRTEALNLINSASAAQHPDDDALVILTRSIATGGPGTVEEKSLETILDLQTQLISVSKSAKEQVSMRNAQLRAIEPLMESLRFALTRARDDHEHFLGLSKSALETFSEANRLSACSNKELKSTAKEFAKISEKLAELKKDSEREIAERRMPLLGPSSWTKTLGEILRDLNTNQKKLQGILDKNTPLPAKCPMVDPPDTKYLKKLACILASLECKLTQFAETSPPDIDKLDGIRKAMTENSYGVRPSPAAALAHLLAKDSGSGKNTALISALSRNFAEWESLHAAQVAELNAEVIGIQSQFFETDPWPLVCETLVWALLGVLTNLLLWSAEHVRKKTFSPVEFYVGVGKTSYGPVLALVLCFAIMEGFVSIGDMQLRATMMALLGFLFGFNSRKTARVIDKLSDRILHLVDQSATQAPAENINRKMERIVRARIAVPIDTQDFLRKATFFAAEAVRNAAATHDKKA